MPIFLEERICKNKDCQTVFKVKRSDPRMFCSRSCAAHFNNTGRKLSRETKLKIASSLLHSPVFVLKSELPKKVISYSPFNITSEDLRRLYILEQLSSGDIAKRYKVTKYRVIKRLKKYEIPRRSPAESNRIKYFRKPPSYNLKTDLNDDEKMLYNSALMLYWGEGAKTASTSNVNLANSDPNIALLFLKALRQVFRIDESKLRVHLYCYANQNVEALMSYWSNLLKVPLEKFIKPYVRQDFDPKKKKRMVHGLVHIVYHDKKLKMKIMNEIDIISKQIQIGQGGRVDNYISL